MSKIYRTVAMMALLSLLIVVFLMGGDDVMTRTNQVPEGAKDFAGKHFLRMVEETLSENPSEYGFKEGKGSITLSELYPVYSLNADFAFGQSDEIIADHQTSWVAVIFQDGQPVRAIGTYQRADGQFALEAIGYAPELPNGLVSLKDDEKVIYFFPDETYYVYSEKANTIMKLERAGEKTVRSSPQSHERSDRLFPAYTTTLFSLEPLMA